MNTFLNKCSSVIHHFNAHFLLYVFANELFLAIYFTCILDYGNDVKQKANLSNFLIQVQKWVIKQQTQFATSTMHLAQELIMNVHTVMVQKFCERDEKLEDEECSDWPSEVDND